MPVETTTAIVGIGGKKDLILEKESMQEFVIDKEIKVVEKDDQKTEIPEIEIDIFKIGVTKDWMPESKITTTSSVDLASENPSYIHCWTAIDSIAENFVFFSTTTSYKI